MMSSSITRLGPRKKKGPMQQALMASFDDLPQLFSAAMFREKIEAAGLPANEALVDRLVDHVFHHQT